MGTKGTISQDLSDLLTTKNFDPVYTDGTGRDSSPAEAVVFSFDYVAGSGKNYGTAVAVLGDQNDLQFFFGDNLGKSIDNPADKNDWFQFLEQLSNFATQHRYTFSPKDINQLKHTMAGIAAIKEGLFEGYYGTRKISYMGEATQARLVIKHKKALEENDRRHLYVESLFIETADGERFKLPFRKLTGGRAMLEHVRQGGKPYDIRGCHIAEMVNEINLLARFNRASQGRVFEGNTAQLVESAQAYYHTLQENLKHLASNRGYQVYFESWTPADIDAGDALVEDIKTLFVEQSIDARIEAALPTLLKIQQQEQVMKEAQIFENWINHLAEGTWALPDTPEQQAKLEELMSQELIAGPDGSNATEQLYDLVGDDQLFDLIGAAAEADPNVNIWDVPEVVDRLQELGVEVPVNQAADEQTPQAVSESHMSEVDSIIQDLISGEADAYNLLTSPTTPEEQYVSNILRKEYEDVSIDHGLHPDDDFEEILDHVLDRLAQDYGHNVAEADSPYFAETTVAGSVAPVAHEMAEGVTSPEIKQAYKDIMNTAPRTLERKSAVRKYLKLHADALDKQRKEQGVAEGELATYLVSVMDSATGEHWRIEVKVTSPEMARERAEAMGYKVLGVKEKLGVAEEAENKDMTGQTCEKCKKGKYQETSIHDDMDGVLHCTKCGTKVDRWRAYKEPSTHARSRQATKDFNRSKSQGMAEGEQQSFVNPHHDDPINANSAITSSYYEGEDPLVRLKSLALFK